MIQTAGAPRLGLLRARSLSANGPDPSTDPGSPYFVDDSGFSRPAVEAAGTLGFCRLLFAPGMMAHAAVATAGGATQLGMLVP
ncbi:hypothetical protein CNO08_22155 [Lysobacter capsici]|nr:hypothetical protein CNO08_22155 [Lysobacter capsici]